MFIRNKIYIVLLAAIGLVLGGCKSSNSNDLMRLSRFLEKVQAIGKEMQPEERGRVEIFDLQPNESLVVINGSYSGSIAANNRISEELAKEIRANVKDESWATFLMLIRNNQIVAITTISMDNMITNTEPIGNNAKIASPNDKYAVLHCQARKNGNQSPFSEVWNSKCYAILLGFE